MDLSHPLTNGLRRVMGTERLPSSALWYLASDGLAQWYSWLGRGVAEALNDKEEARRLVARAATQAFERRYTHLRETFPHLPDPVRDPRAIGLVIAGLYIARRCGRTQWMLTPLGGPFRSLKDRWAAWRLISPLSHRQRWEEVTTHLGEVLIALTEQLPTLGVRGVPALLGRICFDAGARYGAQLRDLFGLSRGPDGAIEILRQGEYIFRVNPEHWSEADAEEMTGFLEGNACPWYARPGWRPLHCGIFGRFQDGVSSEFGLRYSLTKTIPRHGGHTCRIELTPIAEPRKRRA